MRWTKHGVATAFGLFMLAANIQPASAQDSRSDRLQQPRRAREERDRQTDAVFASDVDDRGNAKFSVKFGDFSLEKVLESSGQATIRLSQGKDVVSIAVTQSGYAVSRGRKSARIDAQDARPEDFDAVRALFVGSQAVRSFRRLSASMENRDDDDDNEGPLFLSALVDGAVVAMLDGDSGATKRVAKRIVRRQRSRLRQAAFKPGEAYTDCLGMYEAALLDAWDLYTQCSQWAFSVRWYNWFGAENVCELEWMIRSQQYIYQFISCFAFPF